MRIRIIALGLVWAACLHGQARNFSWQDLCFKNPAAPVCQGNDYAVKPQKKEAPTPSVVTNGSLSTPRGVKASPANRSSANPALNPSLIAVGGIDWRFADPFADAVVGLNFSGISTSSLVRGMITMLGAKQGLTEADTQKLFDRLSGVDQAAISVHNNRMVAMITGSVADAGLPAPEAGLKAVLVSGGAMLIGHAEAVDQAMQRIAMKGPATALTRSYEARQGNSEFWTVGSARSAGPQAASAGLKQFALTVWIRNRVTTDLTLELNGVPSANALRTWQAQLGSAATVEGNAVHVRTSLEADEVQQKFGEIAASPLGQGLAALVEAARYIPVHEPVHEPVPDQTIPKQTKPIIYGLDSH